MSELWDLTIRPATEQDLETTSEIQYEADDDTHNFLLPPGSGLHSKFRYELEQSRFLVAEVDNWMVGFGALFERAGVAFLATLFVRPEAQQPGANVGRQLLEKLLETDCRIRCVVSSANPRALAIYIRAGMLPRWPLYMLAAQPDQLGDIPETGLQITPADGDESDLIRWDADIAGRGRRADDRRYWIEQRGAIPVWFQRAGKRVGYGYIQMLYRSSDAAWFPEAIKIGPIGVRDPGEATACVLSAVKWASRHGKSLHIELPGPHPSLIALLELGFQVVYVATFCSSSEVDVFDPRLYVVADTITL